MYVCMIQDDILSQARR